MSYLIDTHTFLWYVTNNTSLSLTAKQIIGNLNNQIFVSIASIWEIGIKASQNRLTVPQPFLGFMQMQLQQNNFALVPISLEAIAMMITLPYYHKDPFDRIIIAQAMVHHYAVISTDTLFDQYPIKRIW